MKKTIVILSAFIIGVSSCASDNSTVRTMDADIASKEVQLDRFNNVFDFIDTVGETDEYADLVEALDKYKSATSASGKADAYDQYIEAYSKVYAMSMDIIEKRGDE